MSHFMTHHLRPALVIEISGSRKYHFIDCKSLSGRSVWKRYHCLLCLFYWEQKLFKKGEMGQAGEKWDKKWVKVGQMRLSGLNVKKRLTVQWQTWKRQADRGRFRWGGVGQVNTTAGLNKTIPKNNSPRQSSGSPDSSTVCPDSASQGVSGSDLP